VKLEHKTTIIWSKRQTDKYLRKQFLAKPD